MGDSPLMITLYVKMSALSFIVADFTIIGESFMLCLHMLLEVTLPIGRIVPLVAFVLNALMLCIHMLDDVTLPV